MGIDSTFQPEGFVYLRDQEPLSDAEWASAKRALVYAREAFEHREERIRRLRLNPRIWLPASNWSSRRVFYRNFHSLSDAQTLSVLRIYCNQFTGYRLGWLGHIANPEPAETPDEIDFRLQNRQKTAETHIEAYASYVERFGLPEGLQLSPPPKLGEVGWQWRGKIVNYDTVACLERLAVLYGCGLLDRDAPNSLMRFERPRILEIGGGYGGVASFVKRAVPNADYTIVDVPESLAFAAIYLGVLYAHEEQRLGLPAALGASRPGFSFLPNYEFPGLIQAGAQFDLVINTLSFSEMTRAQVRAYCRGVSRAIGHQGTLFEQNQDNRHEGMLNAQQIVRRYFRHYRGLGVPPQHQPPADKPARRYWFFRPGPRLSAPSQQTPRTVLRHGYANLWAHRPLVQREFPPARCA